MLERISIGPYNEHDRAIHITAVPAGELSDPRINIHIAVHAPPEHAKRIADLIAKAPDMLKALEEIVAEWSDPAILGGKYPGFMRANYPNISDTHGVPMAKVLVCDLDGPPCQR